MRKLKLIADSIPLDIPEATTGDRLAQFSDPAALDRPEVASEDLWEEVLNPFLKGVLGWGADEEIDQAIRRGPLGFSGLVDFVGYFTETRGVDEALFEGKLSYLLECATKLMSVALSCHKIISSPLHQQKKCPITT